MRKNTPNEKVLRAISIGLAAMIAVQPVMATPVFADDSDGADGNVAPAPEENKSFETNDTSKGLETIQNAGKAAETSTNSGSCGDALDQAVSAGRDSNVVNSTMNNIEFDKDGGQAINATLNSITDKDTGIQYLNDKLTMLDSNGNAQLDENGNAVVLDIVGERKEIAADAQKLVEEAKRGDSNNFDKTTGNNKQFDAYEIMHNKVNNAALDDSLKGKDLTEAAKAVDDAITAQSKELGSLDISGEADTIEESKSAVIAANEAIESATSLEEAKDALDDAEAAKTESNEAYADALEKYNDARDALETEKATIEALKEDYKALLQNQIADGSYIRQVEKELNQAEANLTKLENDAKKAQEDLANTVIGKMADTFAKTEKKEDWGQLDIIFKDVIKYYYFPMVENIPASEVTFGHFEKKLKDGNYLEVIVNGETRYFNYKSKYSGYNGSALNDKIVIFEKNKEVEVAEHYEDSGKNTVDVKDAVNVLDITSVEDGLVVNTSDDANSKYYKVTGEGTTTELQNEDGVTYTYNEGDVTEKYTIDNNGNLVKTEMASSVTKTTYTTVSLAKKAFDEEYASAEEAERAAGTQAASLGSNASYGDVKVDEYSTFSAKIDLNEVTKNSNKAGDFAEYVNNKLGDSVKLSSDGTFEVTSKASIDELIKTIDTVSWGDYHHATNGNVSEATVKNLIKSAVEGMKNSTPTSKYYKLTLTDVSYDKILSTEELKDQVVSTTVWATDALNHVDTKYKDGPATLNDNYYNYVENNIKNGAIIDLRDSEDIVNKAVRADIEKVNTLQTLYKNAETKANTSKKKIATAQAKVEALIKAIQGEIDSLDGKVNARLVQLEGQLAAAKAELDAAEADNEAVEKAYKDAKEAYERAVERLTPVATPTNGGDSSSAGSDSTTESGTTALGTTGTTATASIAAPTTAAPASALTGLPVAGAPEVASASAGVAGARTGLTGNGVVDDMGGELLEGTDEMLQGELPVVEDDVEKEQTSKKLVKSIKDEEVPLASVGEETAKKMSWWWLLIIALLGATGEEMYRRKKMKEEQAQADSNNNK